ncbi:MAG: GC-type dockerin domain-anchored protein, partial [Planctomycetota bacterium]
DGPWGWFVRIPSADGSFNDRYREGTSVPDGNGVRWHRQVDTDEIFGSTSGDLLIDGLGEDTDGLIRFLFLDPLDGPPSVPVWSGDVIATGEVMHLPEAQGIDSSGNILFTGTFEYHYNAPRALMLKRPGQPAEVLLRTGDIVPGFDDPVRISGGWQFVDGLAKKGLVILNTDTLETRAIASTGRDPLTGEENPTAVGPSSGGGHGGGGPSPYYNLDQFSASGRGSFHMEVDGRMGLYLYDGHTGEVGLALREQAMLEVEPGELREVSSWLIDNRWDSEWAIDDSGAVYARVFFTDHPAGIYRFELVDPNSTCPADVNGDGELGPGDFNAWVAAFNAGGDGCDQNGDGACNPADFNAWVVNFVAGC